MSEPTATDPGTAEQVNERITMLRDAAGLDDVIQQHAQLIAAEVDAEGVHVRSPPRTAAACVLLACRLRETPIRATALADQTTSTKAQVLNEMQRLAGHLDVAIPLERPATIIDETCRELDLSDEIQRRATRLADHGEEVGVMSGVSPYTFTAAALYVVCAPADVELPQDEIASHLDVAAGTLRDRRDDLLEATGSYLFERQFPDAPEEAPALVEDLLEHARNAEWATNKRFLGILGGAWLYAANRYDVGSTAADLAERTGVGESTVRARYEQFTTHFDAPTTTPDRDGNDPP